jgi:hypothetical protein
LVEVLVRVGFAGAGFTGSATFAAAVDGGTDWTGAAAVGAEVVETGVVETGVVETGVVETGDFGTDGAGEESRSGGITSYKLGGGNTEPGLSSSALIATGRVINSKGRARLRCRTVGSRVKRMETP